MRMTGWVAKGTPAVAVEEGCVWIVNWLAAAGLTATLPEVAPARVALAQSIVMVVATVCERLVKVTSPLAAVRLVVPCNTPVPALREAVTTVLMSLLHRLPKASSIRTTGCVAKAAPAVAVAEGGV